MMPRARISGILALAAWMLMGAAAAPQNIDDDFEPGSWSPAWAQEIPFDYSARIVKDPARPGKRLAYELRKADYDGSRRTKGVERRPASCGSRGLAIPIRSSRTGLISSRRSSLRVSLESCDSGLGHY